MMILSIMMKDPNPYNLGYWMESMVKSEEQITKEENATLIPPLPFDLLPDTHKRFLIWKEKKEKKEQLKKLKEAKKKFKEERKKLKENQTQVGS
ncbi:hypothetical protein BN7_3597 [Wickerhamomyces ciferrii]|uniref:Uncharacterized protein n=1 Tax=Wickerhamomyces ciferrii (strain ATCC 14091 / BCRC 22168 / CBS 111 / JCM 3599 / NBRC 0793 / NRRL Y-1031 F-60-10) TaxID=1206466 RepID=K0KRR5_WICCF|nr:uncharacterized protein BN7_3597 [Wickerhamomyces ciferrii]XP_011274139.1 uncharacterized protein BN7_3591 [Wickerhamomyces ciferrii]CCH44034.1 hypothetical protein BN7_3591 [Wickerhamomyces ciferrii]CCH44038.1 hypothetical protein BN7_3597 [Wickerhamomyces ciferrii]